jgi:hypothetical protein
MSRHSRGRFVLGFALALVVFVLGAGTASADPEGAKNARTFTAEYAGRTVEMITNGFGWWHGTHDLGSTSAFVALAVQEAGVFTDPAGVDHPFSRTDVKGSASPNGQPVVTCSFSVNNTFPDGARLVASVTLTGFFT